MALNSRRLVTSLIRSGGKGSPTLLKTKLTEQSGTPLPPGGLIILVTRRFELDTSRGISEAGLSPMVEKCRFSSSAISRGSVVICSAILISEIFPALFDRGEDSSLIKCQVFWGRDLLSSRLSMKYLCLAFLISLFFWYRARLY